MKKLSKEAYKHLTTLRKLNDDFQRVVKAIQLLEEARELLEDCRQVFTIDDLEAPINDGEETTADTTHVLLVIECQLEQDAADLSCRFNQELAKLINGENHQENHQI